MDVEIPYSEIFPQVGADEPLETKMDMGELDSLRNYDSVELQKDEAAIEVERYVQKGFVKILPLETIRKRFPEGTASRLALIMKQKADGSTYCRKRHGSQSWCRSTCWASLMWKLAGCRA